MSLTLPLEDLNRLQVFAQLSKDGFPVLSLNLKSTGTGSSLNPNLPRGIFISFERSVTEDGCWSLSMAACCRVSQGSDLSPLNQNQHMIDPTASLPGFIMNTPSSEPDWLSSAMSQSSIPSLRSSAQGSPRQTMNDNIDIAMMGIGQPMNSTMSSTSTSGSSQDITDMLAGGTAMYSQPQYSAMSSIALLSKPQNEFPDFTTLASGRSSMAPSIDEGFGDNDAEEDSDASAVSLNEKTDEQNRRERESAQRPPVRRKKDLPCFDRHCNQRFMSEHTRRMHMAVHQEKHRKVFVCTQGCTEKFSRQHDRFRHEVSQHGFQSDWTCETCRGFFSTEKSLNSHKCTTSRSKRWKIGVPKAHTERSMEQANGEPTGLS